MSKGHLNIENVEDWFRFAPPKRGARQWKDGRSAKELAKAWCARENRPSPPEEFLRLLTPLVGPDELADAIGWPEHQVPIDDLPGEPPNIDLAIVSDGKQGRTAICVEAKADETFGRYVSEVHDVAALQIEHGRKTGVLKRLLRLETTLFPEVDTYLRGHAELRYQLLTSAAAAIAMAKSCQAPVAVFVVHEFLFVDHVDEKKVRQNELDLDRFVTRLTGGSVTSLPAGALLGPLPPPSHGSDWGRLCLYLGKVRTSGTLLPS